MPAQCYICGKKQIFGSTISHAHNITKRKFKVNLHSARVVINGKVQKVRVCTKCLRKLEKPKLP